MMNILLILVSLVGFTNSAPLEMVHYYQDETNTLMVSAIKDKTFQTTSEINLATDNGTYWFRINKTKDEKSVLELRNSRTRNVKLYDSNNQEVKQLQNTRYPSFAIEDQHLTYPLYLTAHFPLEARFPLFISDEASYLKSEKIDFLSIGFFYGTAVALIMATLIFFMITKKRHFLFFTVLVFAIILGMTSRDNLLNLFDVPYFTISVLELLSHFIVGTTATVFICYYINVRRNQIWIKYGMVIMNSLALVSFLVYAFTENMWAFILLDAFVFFNIALLWVLILKIAKGLVRNILSVIYSVNLMTLLNIFILRNFNLEFIEFGNSGQSILAFIDFSFIAILLFISFKKIKVKGIIMKHKIKHYVEELQELNAYKTVQDANDDYLESLINQFDLENIEVKVLDSISKGHPSDFTAERYNISQEKLDTITKSLYEKLGLSNKDDLAIAFN